MRKPTKKHMNDISKRITRYINDKEWINAKEVLEDEIKIYDREYWLFTTLAMIYYEMNDYEIALKFSEKALEINSEDFLVLSDYACILSMIKGREIEAIDVFERIINEGSVKIANSKYGDGILSAKSMVNDSIVMLAKNYFSLNQKEKGLDLLRQHLSNREKGVFSSFTKREIMDCIIKHTKKEKTVKNQGGLKNEERHE